MQKNTKYPDSRFFSFHQVILFLLCCAITAITSVSLLSANKLYALTLTSNENLTVSAIVENETSPPSQGGSGSGSLTIPKTSTRFSGEAYPDATVTILKDGKTAANLKADKNGFFSVTFEEKYDKTILYSLYAKDTAGNRSLLVNYPIAVTVGYLTHLSGIRLPPTIVLDKIEIRQNDRLNISGYSLPQKELEVVIEKKSKKVLTSNLISESTGKYNVYIPLTGLEKESYTAHIKYKDDTRKSALVNFTIGETNISSTDASFNIPGDCNADGIINLVDFSVLAFWYKKNDPPKCVDINKSGLVDLTDFSILAFYWTN